jgi:pimeloyl-ACP methyl ester carboxylesterase
MRKRWFRRSNAAFGGAFKDLSLIDGEFFDLFIAPLLASDQKISGNTRYLLGIDWELVDGLKVGHGRITVPVLLIWGEEDTVFPVEEARSMEKQFANCKGFITVPGARLFVQEEKPRELIEIALPFLLSNRQARADSRWREDETRLTSTTTVAEVRL